MIIVLQGANFANDNIGQVEIPRELDEFTTELLTHYTKSLTNNQKYAIDDFLTSMRTSGLWDKMGMIFFPMLAGTLEEAFYNPKGTSDAPTSYKGYGIQNGGLIIDITNGWVDGEKFNGGHPTLKGSTEIDVATQGYHYAMLSAANGQYLVGSFKASAYPMLKVPGCRMVANKVVLSFTDVNLAKSLSLHLSNLEAPSGSNISSDKTFVMSAGQFADIQTTFVEEQITLSNNQIYGFLQPLAQGDMDLTHDTYVNKVDTAFMWSVGKALTKQEALLYHQYCEDLLTDFGLR